MSLSYDPSLGENEITTQEDFDRYHHHHHQQFKTECIIVDKVYFSCQQRECFEEIFVPVAEGNYKFLDITFCPGEIVEDSLVISPVPHRPNFSRVRFRVRIHFTLKLKEVDTCQVICVDGTLPEITKDIIVYLPEARDEFLFQIVLETASQALTEPVQEGNYFEFAVGVFIIIKVVGKVQLLVPAYGFCPEPAECEEFLPDDICDIFDEAPFPEFFPPQLDDLCND